MAVELHIFMKDSQVPDRVSWQRQIEQLDFPTVLEPASAVLSSYAHISDQVGSRDKCATSRWGGDLAECGAAISAADALAKVSDGVYFYPDDDILYGADEAVDATRKDLSARPTALRS